MSVQITTAVLDALNIGSHGLVAVQRARKVLEAAGIEVERHLLEKQEAMRLRQLARNLLKEADALDGQTSEARLLDERD